MNINNYLFQSPAKQRSIAYEFRCAFAKKFTKSEYEKLSAKSSSPKAYDDEHDGFCSPAVWADEVMIRHASAVLGINLIFLDMENDRAYCGVHGDDAEASMKKGSSIDQKTGLIAWVGRRHFEPIIRIDSSEQGTITTMFEPAKFSDDAKVVNSIMQSYAEECAL
jgi:hypothetical protein